MNKRGREELLPPGAMKRFNRPPPQAAQGHRLTTNDALSYLRDVKQKFADKKEVYDTFLEIMKEFKAQRIDTGGVIVRVKELFRGHKALVLGFNTFLPKGYEIQLQDVADMDSEPEDGGHGPPHGQPKQPVEFDQAINYVNKIKNRFADDERVYKAFLEILNMYRKGNKTISQVYDEVAVLFKSHHDLLTEFTYFLPDSSPPAGGAHPLLQRVGINTPWHPAPQRGGMVRGPGGRMIMPGSGPRYPPSQAPYNKRKAGRPEHGRLEEEMGGRSTQLERELQFFEKVKSKLRNKDAYHEFLKCLNLFASDIISKTELLALTSDVFVKYPDLHNQFHTFLSRCEGLVSFDDDWRAITTQQRAFGRDVGRATKGQPKDRYFSKPISEVAAELNPDDRCTTSYVRVPSGFPRLTCSGRSPWHHQVLNDSWVSIISGSEDYSFKLMRKNQYEEALFRCEDDRFELDMVIQVNANTLGKLTPLVEAFAAMSAEDKANYRLPDGVLGPVHFRAIEKLYGDTQGPQLVELLKKNPTVAVPVVAQRLEQKDAEWKKVREEMNKVWRKVFEQNYNKSLDHRSFYFKQADKKSLLPKAMMQEVRDAADKRRQDKSQLQTLSVGCPVSVSLTPPDLCFEYPDSSVFEDVYQVVVYALEETLTADVRESVIKLWHTVVEPFFGREQRPYVRLHTQGDPAEVHEAPESSSEEAAAAPRKDEDAADSGAGGGDAHMTDAAPTPEPGTTPEPDEKASALEALLAAGQGDMSEQDEPEKRSAPPDATSEDTTDSTDEEANRFYDVCRPVAGQPQLKAAAAAAAAGAGASEQGHRQHLMYGNDNLYLFLRYHWHLYDRLLTAQRCAREKNQPQQFSAWQTGEAAPRTPEREPTAAAREEARQLHAEFMGMVRRLLDGQLDSSVFEDQCRQLLGTNSYVLFTLDKLVYKFIKHLQGLAADEQTMRLIELHLYERARRAPPSDEVYRANASVIVNDETCFRFEYRDSSAAPAAAAAASSSSSSSPPVSGGQLRIQLLETDKNDTQLLSLDPAFTAYIRSYLCSSAGLKQGKVFAQRSVKRPKGVAADDDPRLTDVLQCAHILNGLEGKISCASSKASYVLDTEDIFYHPAKRARGDKQRDAAAARQATWVSWYDKQLEGLVAKTDDGSLKVMQEVATAVLLLPHERSVPEDKVAYPPTAAALYQQVVQDLANQGATAAAAEGAQ